MSDQHQRWDIAWTAITVGAAEKPVGLGKSKRHEMEYNVVSADDLSSLNNQM